MLTRVEVRTRQGTILNLPFEDIDHGYVLADIDGLDPVKATMVSSVFANLDGEHYQSSRREKRNMKLSLEFEPDYTTNTVSSLRQNLYRFLMPKSEVTLRIYNEIGFYVDIIGRVESFDAPVFTKDPGVVVSLLCFNPDFFDPNPITVSGMTTSGVDTFDIEYTGSVDAGILFKIHPDRDITSFTILHTRPDTQTRQLEFVANLVDEDLVTISTIPGAKGATLTRDNVISSILYGVSPQSDWLALQPGTNHLRVALSGAAVPFDIQYVTRYGGL